MASNDRYQLPFRLSADHMRRLDGAAKYCGQTRQAFVTTTVLAEIAEVEERRKMKRLRVTNHDVFQVPEQEIDTSATAPASIGTGLAESLRQRREIDEPAQPAAPPQGQVVVNVGGNGSSNTNGDFIDRLASYVVAGRDFEQTHRLREVVRILQETTPNEEERKVLAARLDEAVANKAKTKSGTGIVSTARVAFDKIADLLR